MPGDAAHTAGIALTAAIAVAIEVPRPVSLSMSSRHVRVGSPVMVTA